MLKSTITPTSIHLRDLEWLFSHARKDQKATVVIPDMSLKISMTQAPGLHINAFLKIRKDFSKCLSQTALFSVQAQVSLFPPKK